jgi:hypothetical protein
MNQMTHADESFEGRCVVKQEDGQLWSYGEGYDAAMENPIAAWILWQNSLAHLKGRQTEHDYLLGAY